MPTAGFAYRGTYTTWGVVGAKGNAKKCTRYLAVEPRIKDAATLRSSSPGACASTHSTNIGRKKDDNGVFLTSAICFARPTSGTAIGAYYQ